MHDWLTSSLPKFKWCIRRLITMFWNWFRGTLAIFMETIHWVMINHSLLLNHAHLLHLFSSSKSMLQYFFIHITIKACMHAHTHYKTSKRNKHTEKKKMTFPFSRLLSSRNCVPFNKERNKKYIRVRALQENYICHLSFYHTS